MLLASQVAYAEFTFQCLHVPVLIAFSMAFNSPLYGLILQEAVAL